MRDIDLMLGSHPQQGTISVPLSKAPHILVGGMTGSGKSVLLHDILCQVISSRTAREMRLVLIDPKRVEFATYKGIPHLIWAPVYEDHDILKVLKWAVYEMQVRFDRMQERGWRDATSVSPWPRLLVVVDELANLMLKGREFELPLIQIASMGRAAGVHLLLATQRPDASVISGLIRANVPTRIALPTLTAMDSRIILDQKGAEQIDVPQRLIRFPGQREIVQVSGRNVSERMVEDLLRPRRRGIAA